MEKDLFEKILKELLNGKSLRELQEKYGFDRNWFKERINREYPVGTPQREQIEKQLFENKKNSTTVNIPKEDLEKQTLKVIQGKALLEEAARDCGVYIQTFREKMLEYINGSNDDELKRKYVEYQSRINPDYSFINFKALFIEMLKLDMSQSEIAKVYGIPARTVSRELEKFKTSKEFEEIYKMAKESAERKVTRKPFTEYERILMDLILNKIIDLDNAAKSKISEIKEKEENIETYISQQIEKEKELIDSRFLYKRKKTQEKYDEMLSQKTKELDEEKNRQISMLREKYEQEKQKFIEKTLAEII